jgi:hypothetical protein
MFRPQVDAPGLLYRGSALLNVALLQIASEAAIMAQRKNRSTVGKRKSTARSPGSKTSKPARGRAGKRIVAKSKPTKRLAKTMPKRATAKKAGRKRARPVKPPMTPTVETVSVEVIEEGPSGEITISEFEETEVREESEGPEKPEEPPPESEER